MKAAESQLAVLETPRTRLEAVRPHNAGMLWKLMQSPNLREFQDVPRFTREEFERRVTARPHNFDEHVPGRFEWLITRLSEGEAIGWVSLRIGENTRGTAEIGYTILSPHRRAGLAGEAVRAVVSAAFAHTALERIEACCLPANTASCRLLAGAGFKELKRQRNGAVVRGRPVDVLLFGIERTEWLRLHPS